ncbi:hypothetical protein ABTE19_22365, partial [Acinetobacter baumannii]
LDPAHTERLIREIKRHRKLVPAMVKQNLTFEEVALLELHLSELPGIFIEEGQSRYYPEAFATSHAIGYVAAASEAEVKEQP